MDYKITELSKEQAYELDDMLDNYDSTYMGQRLSGNVILGILQDGKLIGGICGTITAFRILYISTLWVDEDFRGKGLGRMLLQELESQAVKLGANTLRADTFGFQGVEFYKKVGFTEAGNYRNEEDAYSEHFFVKML